MFQIKTLNELHNPSENELQICDRLLGPDFFPNSLWLMAMRAHALYHLHGLSESFFRIFELIVMSLEFGQAEVQFDKILAIDPERIDDIDIYSNILYVTDNQLKLSKIAHEFLALDRDRPEVCCLIGE
jgi:anaphase-promoting complex subunit 8